MKRQLFNHKKRLLKVLFCFGLLCVLRSTTWAHADLWIRDNIGDTGAEPNNTTSVFSISPDIWITYSSTPGAPEQFDPLSGSLNWVHIKVRNRGNTYSTGTENLHLYWAKGSTALAWPTQWINYTTSMLGCTATLFGDEIGSTTIPALAPGDSTDIVIQWWAPNLADYSCLSDPGHFCLLARIIPGMTYTETANIIYNTQFNNNIAWRNYLRLKLPCSDTPEQGTVLVRNVRDAATTMKLRVAIPDNAEDNVFDNAAVDMVLDNVLYQKWQVAGLQGENIEDQGEGTIRLLNADAWIGGIPMQPNETYQAGLAFARVNDDFTGIAELDMIQEDNGEATGGERFGVDFARDGCADELATDVSDKAVPVDGISVYPNPAQTEFTISNVDKSAGYSIRMFDATGREVYSTKFSGEVKVRVENLPKGTYYIEISNALAGTKTTKQIVVK